MHGGKHFHVMEKGKTVARVLEDGGKVVTGKAPNSVIKFLLKKGLLKGLAGVGLLLEIADAPDVEGGDLLFENELPLFGDLSVVSEDLIEAVEIPPPPEEDEPQSDSEDAKLK